MGYRKQPAHVIENCKRVDAPIGKAGVTAAVVHAGSFRLPLRIFALFF